MNYKVTRTIIEACDLTNLEQDRVMESAKYIAYEYNKIVETDAFPSLKKVEAKTFEKLKKMVKGFQLFRMDRDGNILEQESLYVNKKLNPSDTCCFRKTELLYLCWVLKATNLYKENVADLYGRLLEIVGQEESSFLFCSVEDVALNLVLQTNQGFGSYVHLLRDWMEKEELGSLVLPYAKNINDLTLMQCKNIVESGMEEVDNVHATRVSMATINSEFHAVLLSGIFDGTQGIHDIFTKSFCEKIVNTEARRKFYFFRILLRIIEKQVEDIKVAIEEYCNGNSKLGTQKIEELVSNCWFVKVKETGNYSDIPWSKIAEGPRKVIRLETEEDERITLEQMEADLWNSRLRPSSIAKAFNDAFSIHGFAFEKESEDGTGRNVAPRIQKLLLEQNQKISREMLLLTVLLARANGIDEQMNMDYVREHVLFNSRYSKKLDEKRNEIDAYFKYLMEAFDEILRPEARMKLLKEVSEELTWDISQNVFHDILYNKGGNWA